MGGGEEEKGRGEREKEKKKRIYHPSPPTHTSNTPPPLLPPSTNATHIIGTNPNPAKKIKKSVGARESKRAADRESQSTKVQ